MSQRISIFVYCRPCWLPSYEWEARTIPGMALGSLGRPLLARVSCRLVLVAALCVGFGCRHVAAGSGQGLAGEQDGPVELWGDSSHGGGDSDAQLQKMQAEAARQLVEARRRKYKALLHRIAAIKLAEAAEEDKTKAALLKRKSALATKDAALSKSEKAVQDTKDAIARLHKKQKTLAKKHDQDAAKADKAKENVMDLESKAGTLQEKAQEEASKIASVKKAAATEQVSIPHLLRSARENEESATHLKADAHARMDDSRRKTEEAYRLDRVAEEKEREAKMIRGRLIAILEERTKMLDAKERDAAREKKLASKGAKDAAAEAQKLAAEAASKAKVALEAGRSAEALMSSEQRAQDMVRAESVNVKQQAHLVADAKRAYDHAKESLSGGKAASEGEGEGDRDREEDAKVGELKHEEVVMHHKVLQARRQANMLKAARESEKLHASGHAAEEGHDVLHKVLDHKKKQWMEAPVGAAKHLAYDGKHEHATEGSKGWIKSAVDKEERLAGTETRAEKAKEMLDAGAGGVRQSEHRRMLREQRRREVVALLRLVLLDASVPGVYACACSVCTPHSLQAFAPGNTAPASSEVPVPETCLSTDMLLSLHFCDFR